MAVHTKVVSGVASGQYVASATCVTQVSSRWMVVFIGSMAIPTDLGYLVSNFRGMADIAGTDVFQVLCMMVAFVTGELQALFGIVILMREYDPARLALKEDFYSGCGFLGFK